MRAQLRKVAHEGAAPVAHEPWALERGIAPVTTRRTVRRPAGPPTWRGHLRILRLDHWFKNVFAIPGVVVALSTVSSVDPAALALRLVVAALALGLVASSNYVLNEIQDAPYDRLHPVKRSRPVPSGEVHVGVAYAQWIACALVGFALGAVISWAFVASLLALWAMGCVYNLPPVRTKDVPYLDVLSEAVNNPLRMLAGWFVVTSATAPPLSLLVSYWMIGCYFMAIKRFAEQRDLGDGGIAVAYRKSFARYTSQALLVSIMFYGSAAMLFFGAFVVRYRFELVLAFPLIALVMAIYLNLGFQPDSPTEHPEKLYRVRSLMTAVVVCAVAMTVLTFVDLSFINEVFTPGLQPR